MRGIEYRINGFLLPFAKFSMFLFVDPFAVAWLVRKADQVDLFR